MDTKEPWIMVYVENGAFQTFDIGPVRAKAIFSSVAGVEIF